MGLYKDYNNLPTGDICRNVQSAKEDEMEKLIRCE
jgi:hypothetical protein